MQLSRRKLSPRTGLTLNYTVPAEEANQVDLMYAVATNQTKPDNGNSVTMPFKHALTQVHFAIGTSATNLFVDVEENGIQIHNLKNTGTFASSTEAWTLNTEATPASYTVTSDAINEAGYQVTNGAQAFTTIGSADKALMLLPQTLEANTENVGTGNYLTINCKIYQKLADGIKIYLKGSESKYGSCNSRYFRRVEKKSKDHLQLKHRRNSRHFESDRIRNDSRRVATC